MIKVSIIVPVYNTEKYLTKCIKSLINQTLKEIELIFVNDGSTDNSKNIINEFKIKDKRIKLINQENSGQGKARNVGLANAKGEYIAFVDSDDYVLKDTYEILYKRAKKDNLDMVLFDYYFSYEDKLVKKPSIIMDGKEKIINDGEYITLTPSPCNKLIKKTFLDKSKFKFAEGFMYEDLAAIPLLGLYNPKIVYINKYLYYYVQSTSSETRNDTYKEKYEDIFKAIKYLYDNMIDKGKNLELEYLVTYHFLYSANLNFYKYKKYRNIDKVASDMHLYFPKWYNNSLVLKHFNKKEIVYMKLFYYKKYQIINIYRRLLHKNETQ